jgi:cytochrome d ubiquinol oxidase subunit I
MGVVTGIVQEFQFGMNWSEYSRYVGDIFGAPLAIEALLAFFLESTFLGLWIFGWERLSRKTHLLAIWLVAIGSNISAFWILAANSFMQSPVGYAVEGGRLVMKDFLGLLVNPYVWGQFPHTVFSGFTTAAFFVIGISAFHIFRKQNIELFNRSLKIAVIFGLISVIGVVAFGDSQAKRLVTAQPMKLAAAEGLLNTENPASLSIFSIINVQTQEDVVRIGLPNVLSFMAFNTFEGEVKGMKDLQLEYTQKYGAGNYIPNEFMSYWTFRIMVGLGFLMLGVLIILLIFIIRKQPLPSWKWLTILFPWVISFPYIANTNGWLLTELGRQPWLVFGLMKTADGVSTSVSDGEVLTTLILYTLVYGILMVADVYLLVKFAKAGPQEIIPEVVEA